MIPQPLKKPADISLEKASKHLLMLFKLKRVAWKVKYNLLTLFTQNVQHILILIVMVNFTHILQTDDKTTYNKIKHKKNKIT